MRLGEILALRWQNRIITVPAGALEENKGSLRFELPKSEAGRRDITLSAIVVETLREYRRQQLGKLTDDVLLFARPGGAPQSPHALSKAWSGAAADIGLDVTFRALRHTHASSLTAAGIDVVKISKRLAHASPAVTLDVYAHMFSQREDKSAEAINEAVAALLSVC